MPAPIAIHRYADIATEEALHTGLDAVFFESSNTQSFESAAHRATFRERWLGRYLAHDPGLVFVALDPQARVAGYIAGSVDDPAIAPRFADIGYFAEFKDLTWRYPAHLHVNIDPEFRGQGLGGRLIDTFAIAARQAGAPGVHVVTSRGARNVVFYTRNGFAEAGAAGEGAREVVFLARGL